VSTLSLSTQMLFWESGTLFVDFLETNSSDLNVFGEDSHITVNEMSPDLSTLKLYNTTKFEFVTNNYAEIELFCCGLLRLAVESSEIHPKLILNGTVDISGITLDVEILGDSQDSKLVILEAYQM